MRRYSDVEDLIFRGFLSTKTQIGELCLVVKSLNNRELKAIQERTPLKSHPKYDEIFEGLILTYSLYLLDGENVLESRPSNLVSLLSEMKDVPSNIRSLLMGQILLLQKSQDIALKDLEAFSYGQSSRSLWKSYIGRNLNDPMLTGISGTGTLGLNSHQIAWTYLNTEEDTRLQEETLWGFSKFIASATNPKGVKKLEEKDQERLKRLHEDREKVVLNQSVEGPVTQDRRSVKDLTRQLEDDIAGKQDMHDLIISQYETSIRDRQLKRAELNRLRLEKAREDAKQQFEDLSDEELAEKIRKEGFFKIISEEQIKNIQHEQSQQTLKHSQDVFKNKHAIAEQYAKDQSEIAIQLQKTAQESRQGAPESIDIPER